MPSRKRAVLPVAGEPEEDVASWPTGRLLSVAARLVESRFDDVLAGHDLTHAGLIVLHHLQAQPRTQRELAVLCRVTDQTMSRTTERLERTGLVTRGVDPDDRRRTIAQITDAGRRTLAEARREERESQLLLGVVDDYEHFRAQLLKIVRHGSEG
ncbi:DNA-binding transcriptional regulator, MarR family [Saccharopolyspora kobensis]|uniref:DNA-binding transcriptional regulator, MarR family n=1 Tax=Saccharopolyspora kobensis TaxID=146035 RepID=A0A1H5UE52_9PSEU|nr:MarR family transcriptional regulator [Saccharopolyspora kobensis]SEF73286.1 DNA-binding transcriptional regulator, MarR family [Saccharopolyspora kobensis]SFC74438.1 DNA-binding transcriptional regulator, MarR family [Saccharopolyspora kobensis]